MKIAFVEYDFAYHKLIESLKLRGEAIQKLDFNLKRDIEAKINKYILRNKGIFERPKQAFITFEYTAAHNLIFEMITLDKYSKVKFVANPAPAPSNIIWEHRN